MQELLSPLAKSSYVILLRSVKVKDIIVKQYKEIEINAV